MFQFNFVNIMWSTKKTLSIFILAISFPLFLKAQDNLNNSDFKQLHEELPTPNVYRTASGAPGHEYYQQKADYIPYEFYQV